MLIKYAGKNTNHRGHIEKDLIYRDREIYIEMIFFRALVIQCFRDEK